MEREQLLRNQTYVWFCLEEVDEKTVSTGIRNLGDEYPSLAGPEPSKKLSGLSHFGVRQTYSSRKRPFGPKTPCHPLNT